MDELCFKGYKAHVPPKWAAFADIGTNKKDLTPRATSSLTNRHEQQHRSPLHEPRSKTSLGLSTTTTSSPSSNPRKSQAPSFTPSLTNVEFTGICSTTLSGATHPVPGMADLASQKKAPHGGFNKHGKLSRLVSSSDRSIKSTRDIHYAKYLFGPEKKLGLEAFVHDSSEEEDPDSDGGTYKKVRPSSKVAAQLRADKRRQSKHYKTFSSGNSPPKQVTSVEEDNREDDSDEVYVPKKKATWIQEMSAYCAKKKIHEDAKARTVRLEQELRRRQEEVAKKRERLLAKYAVVPPSMQERHRALEAATSMARGGSPTDAGGEEEAEGGGGGGGNDGLSWRERAKERLERQSQHAQIEDQQRRWYQSLLCVAKESEAATVQQRLNKQFEERQTQREVQSTKRYEHVLKKSARAKLVKEYESAQKSRENQDHIEECRLRAHSRHAEYISNINRSHKKVEKRLAEQQRRKKEADESKAAAIASENEAQRIRFERSNAEQHALKERQQYEAQRRMDEAYDRFHEKQLQQEERVLEDCIGSRIHGAEKRRTEQRSKQLADIEAHAKHREKNIANIKKAALRQQAQHSQAQMEAFQHVEENRRHAAEARIVKAQAIMRKAHSPSPPSPNRRPIVDGNESRVVADLVAHQHRKQEIDDDFNAYLEEKSMELRQKEDAHSRRQENIRMESLNMSVERANTYQSKCDAALQIRMEKEAAAIAKAEADEAALLKRLSENRRQQQQDFDRTGEERAKRTMAALDTVNVKKRQELVDNLNSKARVHQERIGVQNALQLEKKRQKNADKSRRAQEMREMVDRAEEERAAKYETLLRGKNDKAALAEWHRQEQHEAELRRLQDIAHAQRERAQQQDKARQAQFEAAIVSTEEKNAKVDATVKSRRDEKHAELQYNRALLDERTQKAQTTNSQLLKEKADRTQSKVVDAMGRSRPVAMSPTRLSRPNSPSMPLTTGHHGAIDAER